MIIYNDKSNLLEDTVYRYQLQDVKEPNLYRELFDYESIPKIAFNHRHVPMNMPDEIWMTDTTFRDGQQSTSPFTVKQIVDLYKLMARLGGPKGLVRQSEFFLYSKKDKEALRACQDTGLKFPEITTWIRADERDFELVKQADVKETGILVSCSDYHIFKKMHLNRKQALDKYLGIVKSALSYGIRPRCHFEDITRADFYGFVIPFASELMRLMEDSGIPIKIRMCDTMGFGVTFPGVTLPRSVQGIVYGLYHYANVPHDLLEWHGHNDFYKVVTNASTAWLYGASAVNCSLLGIGERTGNCPLEAMAMEYAALRGTMDGMDFTAITEIADYFEREINYIVPPQDAFCGPRFQFHPRGHPCGRASEGRGDLQHLRYGEDPQPSRARLRQQDERPCGHRLLDQRLLQPARRVQGDEERSARRGDEGARGRRVRGGTQQLLRRRRARQPHLFH